MKIRYKQLGPFNGMLNIYKLNLCIVLYNNILTAFTYMYIFLNNIQTGKVLKKQKTFVKHFSPPHIKLDYLF